MNIEGVCNHCERRFLLRQILPEPGGTSGRCPFCGFHFGRHYTNLVSEAIEEAHRAAASFVMAVSKLTDVEAGFTVDLDSLAVKVRESLSGNERSPA